MKVTTCPECGVVVVQCDNDVLLDHPAVLYDDANAPWTIMSIGSLRLASTGNPSPEGLGHTLHEHQLEGSAMAS